MCQWQTDKAGNQHIKACDYTAIAWNGNEGWKCRVNKKNSVIFDSEQQEISPQDESAARQLAEMAIAHDSAWEGIAGWDDLYTH